MDSTNRFFVGQAVELHGLKTATHLNFDACGRGVVTHMPENLHNNPGGRYGISIINGDSVRVKPDNISCATHYTSVRVNVLRLSAIGEPVCVMSRGDYDNDWNKRGTKIIFTTDLSSRVPSSSLWLSPHCIFGNCDPCPESCDRNNWVDTYSIVYNAAVLDGAAQANENVEGLFGDAFVFRWFNNSYTGDHVNVDIDEAQLPQIMSWVQEAQKAYFSPLIVSPLGLPAAGDQVHKASTLWRWGRVQPSVAIRRQAQLEAHNSRQARRPRSVPDLRPIEATSVMHETLETH